MPCVLPVMNCGPNPGALQFKRGASAAAAASNLAEAINKSNGHNGEIDAFTNANINAGAKVILRQKVGTAGDTLPIVFSLSVEATRSVFVPLKVVFTFTITLFLSLENFSFC